jgi:RNA polymerase sigma-70 factor (ECF subfamily)
MDEHSQQQARSFDAVIGTHFDALYRAAMRLTRCHEDAEDLVQDVILRAMPELARLATLDAPLAWLVRVQYRLFVDTVRHRKHSPIAAKDGDLAIAGAISEDPGPEELTAQGQRYRALALVWSELNRNQQALLALHAEGYTLGDLEAITGLSRNAIGVRLHRARIRLAQLVGSETTNHLKEG